MSPSELLSQNPQLGIIDLLNSGLSGTTDPQWNRLIQLILAEQQDIVKLSEASGGGLFYGSINVNPTVTCDFTLSGTVQFQAGMAVNDIFGNSGNIITTDGDTTMTLNNMNASSPPIPATFSGTITGTGSTTATTAPSTQTMVLAFTLGVGSPRAVIGNTVTDSLGSTGIIEATNGTTTMTLGSLNMVASSGFTGLITFGSTGTGTAGAQSLNVPFSSLVGNWYLTGRVTDTNGNQGTLQTVTGDVLTLVTLTFSGTTSSFSGTLTSTITTTASFVDSFSWGDQTINLAGGTSFAEVDLLLYGIDSTTALDLQLWDGQGRTGTQYFASNNGVGDSLTTLTTGSYIDSADLLVPTAPKLTVPNVLYATVSTVDSTQNTIPTKISGIILT